MDLDPLSGRIALIVDDEPLFVLSVSEALHAAAPALEVVTARDGAEALEILDRQTVDVVVTDVQMPRLDGFGLISEIIERGLDVSVIMMTAYGRPTLRERDRLALVIECVEKPIDLDDLLEVLAQVIRLRQTRQLRAVSLRGLLQLLELERGDAAIRVQDGARVAWLHVAAGRLVAARLGLSQGPGIARTALAWPEPQLEVHLLPREHAPHFDAELSALLSTPTPTPITTNAGPQTPEEYRQMNTKQSLEQIGQIQGALGASLVDFESGMTLGTVGAGLDLEIASAGNMEVMRAKRRVMKELGISGGIEDILITLETQYHIIRPVGDAMFLYLALRRSDGNLAMARRKLAGIASELEVS